MRNSDTWILNTQPSHWEECAYGRNAPWHGIPEGGRGNPTEMNSGDLLIVRQTRDNEGNFGVRGVWEFKSCERVESQEDVPDCWRNHEDGVRNYEWFIYCQDLASGELRELNEIYQEDFDKLDISTGKLTGTAVSLSDSEKRKYLDSIRKHDSDADRVLGGTYHD